MEQGDDGFKRGVSALLRKRGEILSDLTETRERIAQNQNDLEAVERCLALMGHDGELPTQDKRKPKKGRVVLYYRNELRTFIRRALESSDGPLTTRDIALDLIDREGRNPDDRRLYNDIVKRVSAALGKMRNDGAVTAELAKGCHAWSLTGAKLNAHNKAVEPGASG